MSSSEAEVSVGANTTRRASIAAALAGIQRFKKSRLSVFLLKGIMAIGQVIALVTLMILAKTTRSPLFPHASQLIPSSQCPRPQLFLAWMVTNAVRLSVCWAVSCWMLLRSERHDRREGGEEEVLEGNRGRPLLTPSTSLALSLGTPSLAHSHSSTSTSGATLSTPLSSPSSAHPSPTVHVQDPTPPSLRHLSPREPHAKAEREGDEGLVMRDFEDRRMGRRRSVQARQLVERMNRTTVVGGEQAGRFTGCVDRWAPRVSVSCGALSAVLFVLGNILVFHPAPTDPHSCYYAAPLLWWAVMTVTGVGWFLIAQVVFIAGVVGTLLHRCHILPPAPAPDAPRPPQPTPLAASELQHLRIVSFVPPEMDQTIDKTRLPYPPLVLEAQHTICAIFIVSLLSTVLVIRSNILAKIPLPERILSLSREVAMAALQELDPSPARGEVYFLSHGGPPTMYDTETRPYKAWQKFGKAIEKAKPRGLVVVSAHWENQDRNSSVIALTPVNTDTSNPLVYDFYGFPAKFYKETFESRGDKKLLLEVGKALRESGVEVKEEKRGLDHGIWVPFKVAFEGKTDIPIVQVSLPGDSSPESTARLGKGLAALRDQGYGVMGTGQVVHNLRDLFSGRPMPYSTPFLKDVSSALSSASPLQSTINLFRHPMYKSAHPTPEHLLPLVAAVAATREGEAATPIYVEEDGGLGWGMW
ncbi:4,5-DOPA dioxygenase extradiol, partial [Tremellales sp. Uapishka_1]